MTNGRARVSGSIPACAYLLSIHQLPEVDEAAAHVEGADAVLVRHAQPQVVGVVAHVHREGLVPNRVQVVVDDPRLEDAGGAQRPRHEGVRLVLVDQVEEAPAAGLGQSHLVTLNGALILSIYDQTDSG